MISSKDGAYKSTCAEKYMSESEWINHELMKNPAYEAAKEAERWVLPNKRWDMYVDVKRALKRNLREMMNGL